MVKVVSRWYEGQIGENELNSIDSKCEYSIVYYWGRINFQRSVNWPSMNDLGFLKVTNFEYSRILWYVPLYRISSQSINFNCKIFLKKCLSFSWCGTHFPYFWIFAMAFKRWQIAPRVTFSVCPNCSCDWVGSSSNNACNSSSSNFFAAPGCSLSVKSKSLLLNWRNHVSHVHHKFLLAIDELQLLFSFDELRKGTNAANAIYLERNSIYSLR